MTVILPISYKPSGWVFSTRIEESMLGGQQYHSKTNLVASPLEPLSIKLHCITIT